MEPCDLVNQWENLTAQERLDALEELINATLQDNGYLPVTLEISNLTGAFGHFDDVSNHIRFDADRLENSSVDQLIITAFHEAGHAMEFQDGDYEALSDAEQEQYNDEFIVEGSSMDFEENDFHPDIEAYAVFKTNELLKECQSQDPAAGDIYGSSSDLPLEMEIGEPVVTDAPPEGSSEPAASDADLIEFDLEKAVFSSGGKNE